MNMMDLSAWAQAVEAGTSSQSQWEALFQGEDFSSLAYVVRAFDLPVAMEQALALSIAKTMDNQQLSYHGIGQQLGVEFTYGQLLDSLCFDESLLSQGLLRPHKRVLAFAFEGDYLGFDVPKLSLWQGGDLPHSAMLHQKARQMEGFLQATPQPVTFHLWGEAGAGRRTLAKTLCQRLDCPLLLAELEGMEGWSDHAIRTALVRESKLMGCPVCLAPWQEHSEGLVDGLLKALALSAGCSFACTEVPRPMDGIDVQWRQLDVAVPTPTVIESRQLWQGILAGQTLAADVNVNHCATLYRFTPGQICKAVETAENDVRWRGGRELDAQGLLVGCRSQLRHSLGEKARRVEPVFTWEELVLPERSVQLLHAACVRMQNRDTVMEHWGFGEKLPYGAGLSMLFSGPPGTGKTMGAQVVARELGLELYKVDLATIVSKYVGETEKNLSIIFREASRSGAVLFFDEADALFGKRTEVKDAHDRYNNMEAAYLLQKIEEYDGVSVLATNFLQNIDDAFRRRLTYIIEFPFPDKPQRLELWERVFPKATPVEEGVDWDFLATNFELSGSGIKSCGLSAAYLAAGDGGVVGMNHLLVAIRRELEKSGKSVSREEFGQYYMLLH